MTYMVETRAVTDPFILKYGLPGANGLDHASTAEVATWLGISSAAFRYWRNKGKGPRYDKWGSKFVYKQVYIHEYMNDVFHFFLHGNATGLIPFKGTFLEQAAQEWHASLGEQGTAGFREPTSPDRPASVLQVDNHVLSFTVPNGGDL